MVVMAALIYAKREHLYQVDSLSMTLVSDQGYRSTASMSCRWSRNCSGRAVPS